jgi:hypothetical protein
MKKLLLIPMLLITSFCFSQDAKEIIGKPVKIGNLLVAENDFPESMEFYKTKKALSILGKGWRLPTKSELNLLYKNKEKIGGFGDENRYWSSTMNNRWVWSQYFGNGSIGQDGKTVTEYYVRAVKTFIK